MTDIAAIAKRNFFQFKTRTVKSCLFTESHEQTKHVAEVDYRSIYLTNAGLLPHNSFIRDRARIF